MPHPLLIHDGGTGRELLRRGAPFAQPQWSVLALMQRPSAVADMHRAYIEAGANITTNSYAFVPFHLGEDDFRAQGDKLAASPENWRSRLSGTAAKNCASPPHCHHHLAPAAQTPAIARPLVDGQAPYADLWLAETQSSTAEVRTLHTLAPHDHPFWASFTLDDEHPAKPPRLHSGESIADAVATVIDLGADALLFNCSHPEIMADAIVAACAALDTTGSTLRLGVYANAFCAHDAGEAALPANNGLDDIRTDLSPAAYLALAQTWRAAGADIIGGCCGIGPEHIAALATWRDSETLPK